MGADHKDMRGRSTSKNKCFAGPNVIRALRRENLLTKKTPTRKQDCKPHCDGREDASRLSDPTVGKIFRELGEEVATGRSGWCG